MVQALLPVLSTLRFGPLMVPANVVAAVCAVKSVAAAPLLRMVPAEFGSALPVVCVICRTAWFVPVRSSVPPLTTRSATVGAPAVGMTSRVFGPAPRFSVPSLMKVPPVLRLFWFRFSVPPSAFTMPPPPRV